MAPQWDIQDLSFAYRGQGTVFDQLSFSLTAGTFTGVAGPNGAGKTTLIHLLSGTLKPSAGKVGSLLRIDGTVSLDVSSGSTRGCLGSVSRVGSSM